MSHQYVEHQSPVYEENSTSRHFGSFGVVARWTSLQYASLSALQMVAVEWCLDTQSYLIIVL